MTAPGVTHDIPPEEGDALLYWRTMAGMTQRQVAEQIFIEKNGVNRYERHKGRIPPWRMDLLVTLFKCGTRARFLQAGRTL